MSIDVDPGVLTKMSGAVDKAATGLDATGRSAPGSVDAGMMTGFITGRLGQFSNSAAGLVEGLHAISANLHSSHSAYASADESAASNLHATVRGFQ
ncbi:MAG: hypothetical protein ACRDPH_04050 [Marmoricola sp.]